MSKHQTNTTIWNRLRRGLACLLSLALLAGLIPGTAVTAYAASGSHWAMPYAQKLVDWGVMRGDASGNLRLDSQITRAEFVAMMNRAYGYTKLGGHPFTDVRIRDWYAEDIDIAYNMGYFKGTSLTTASPNAPLSREQATVLLARNMMLRTKPGESLTFSDSRLLSEWSRGEVAAAAECGLVTGMADGSFQPKRNITRGEVAVMLARAIGNPINAKGDHTLGNVYGNVTVSTAGVTLRDGVIAGNLYLTGGIDLGDVLLQNVNVLGEIVVSGGGESNSSAASIIMRNVTADSMTVDSISDQFVTIRAEGNTSIPTTTVRTNAYVDDSSLPGFGLSYIELDGDPGTMLQLAGNVKEVLNRTPQSDLQVVQGTAQKITMDEYATDSTVLVDGDARVDELNLDVATNVTGTGDINNLNVGAAGSTVEQLPDNITIRPGITSDIAGTNMNSTQAAESSADPRLLAGYPKVKNIAPNSATLVFSTNKPGTVYWAISAVSDGSVGEDDLIEPPVYGGNIIQSGTINATAAKTEYTVNLTGLIQDGSYYVSAILVDGRGNHSPVKVTAFTTPDGTTPAFNNGYPYMSKVSTEIAQVTVMPNKSCRMFYALLPYGSTAPTPQDFKANAITGNLGYGVVDVVKNVTQPVNVNSTRLQELTQYTLYLWLTDHDNAKSSQVYSLNFTTPDEQPPVIVTKEQTNADATAIELTFTLNEGGTLYWVIIPEGQDKESSFEGISEGDWNKDTVSNPDDRRLQIRIENGAGSSVVKNGRKAVNAAYTNAQVTLNETRPLDAGTSNYTMYLVAKDAAGNYSKVEKIHVHTRDGSSPTVRQEFSKTNEGNQNQPLVDTDIRLIFSENVQGGSDQSKIFLDLYQKVKDAPNDTTSANRRQLEADARNTLAKALSSYIKLYNNNIAGDERSPVAYNDECVVDPATGEIVNGTKDPSGTIVPNDDWVINYCAATVEQRNGELIVTFPTGTGLRLTSGGSYHFIVSGIRDLSADDPNPLDPDPTNLPPFTTMYARVSIDEVSERPPVMTSAKLKNTKNADGTTTTGKTIFTASNLTDTPLIGGDGDTTGFPSDIFNGTATSANTGTYANWDVNKPQRIDYTFTIDRLFDVASIPKDDPNMCYDILIWSDTNMDITIYSRPLGANGKGTGPWEWEGVATYRGTSTNATGGRQFIFRSLTDIGGGLRQPDYLSNLEDREYAIHVERLNQMGNFSAQYDSWSDTINLQVSVVAGPDTTLTEFQVGVCNQNRYNEVLAKGLSSIGVPDPFNGDITFTDRAAPKITQIRMTPSDTSPTISITMDHPGQVNYIIVPVSSAFYKENADAAEKQVLSGTPVTSLIDKISSYFIPEEVVVQGDTASPPLPITTKLVEINSTVEGKGTTLTTPSRDRVVDGVFSDTSGIIKGTTEFVGRGSAARINLNGRLTPNTIYILCAVPQGSTPQSYADYAMGYYFTTEMPERPVLKLENTGSTNVTATVDRTSTVQSKLLIMSGLTEHLLKDRFSRHVDTTLYPEFTGSKYDKSTYTVLNALFDDYEGVNPGPNGYPSVFDQFADDDTKRNIRQLIESGGVGELVKANWGPAEIPVTGNATTGQRPMTYTGPDLKENVDYVCLALAKGDSADSYAFRATYPLQLMNDQQPKILAVSPDLIYDEAAKEIKGQIVISFDRDLYREPSGYKRLPVTQSGNTPTAGSTVNNGGTHYGLGGAFTVGTGVTIFEKPQGNTNAIVLDVQKSGTADITITFPAVLCNRWGSPITAGVVTVSYDKTNDRFTYTVSPRSMMA